METALSTAFLPEGGSFMLRTVGLILLCGSFVAGGFVIGALWKKGHGDTLYLLLLVRHLSREMRYSSKPLKGCFAGFPDQKRKTVTDLFSNRAFEEGLSLLRLPHHLKDPLLNFFINLGKEDAEEEESRCRRMITILEEEEERLRLSVEDRVKVSRTVGIYIGGVLLLLLL